MGRLAAIFAASRAGFVSSRRIMVYEHDREAFDLVSELEEQSNFTMKAGRSLVQIVSQPFPAPRKIDQLDLFAAAG